MTRARFPVDEHGTTPTPKDWEEAKGSLERHLATAARSPRFDATRQAIAERQATLADLRRAFHLSQVTLAENLDMSQSELSRLERRADLLLSTLSRFVAATGGHLRLVADYPDRSPIELRLAALTDIDIVGDLDTYLDSIQPARPEGVSTMTEKTSKKAASNAARTLTSPTATPAAKSAAGSALAQRGTSDVTSKAAAAKAAKTLASPSASRAAKSAAGSALTQRAAKGKR